MHPQILELIGEDHKCPFCSSTLISDYKSSTHVVCSQNCADPLDLNKKISFQVSIKTSFIYFSFRNISFSIYYNKNKMYLFSFNNNLISNGIIISPIPTIPRNLKELEQKLKFWLTFS